VCPQCKINLGFSVFVSLQGNEADGRLPYWLSNTSALLCLLQRNLRSNGLFATPSRRSGGTLGKIAQVRNLSMMNIISVHVESIIVINSTPSISNCKSFWLF
jgi:hypothetical protein